MLRLLAVALLLANVLFFGWAQGLFEPAWPAPRHAEREPARLKAQFRPEAVTVSTPVPAEPSARP